MTESISFSSESMSTGLNQLANMMAETMQSLVAILDRGIDAVSGFAQGVAQKVQKLAEQFKAFLLADKEIILHKHAHHLMKDLHRGLKAGDAELHNNSHKIFGMVQEMRDFFERRLLDASYREYFSFLYVEDIAPEMDNVIAKLYIKN